MKRKNSKPISVNNKVFKPSFPKKPMAKKGNARAASRKSQKSSVKKVKSKSVKKEIPAPLIKEIKSPISVGQEYDLEIEQGKNGYGIGFVKDFPVMVPDVVVGDSVHVQIIKVKSDHAIGRVMSSEEPQLPGENIEEEYAEAEEKAAEGIIPPMEEGGEEEG